jgi:hypothetical protein
MIIKLLPPQAKQIAEDILEGLLPPETSDLEVISWLLRLDPELTVYRIDEFTQNGGGDRRLSIPTKVQFSPREILIALENRIEMRPILR